MLVGRVSRETSEDFAAKIDGAEKFRVQLRDLEKIEDDEDWKYLACTTSYWTLNTFFYFSFVSVFEYILSYT